MIEVVEIASTQRVVQSINVSTKQSWLDDIGNGTIRSIAHDVWKGLSKTGLFCKDVLGVPPYGFDFWQDLKKKYDITLYNGPIKR